MSGKPSDDFNAKEAYKKLFSMVGEIQHTLNNNIQVLQVYDHRINHLEDEMVRINDIISED